MSIEQMNIGQILELYTSDWKLDPKTMMFYLITKNNKVLASVTVVQAKEWERKGLDWQSYILNEVIKGVNNEP